MSCSEYASTSSKVIPGVEFSLLIQDLTIFCPLKPGTNTPISTAFFIALDPQVHGWAANT